MVLCSNLDLSTSSTASYVHHEFCTAQARETIKAPQHRVLGLQRRGRH